MSTKTYRRTYKTFKKYELKNIIFKVLCRLGFDGLAKIHSNEYLPFYRKYPYHGRVELFISVDNGVMIDYKLGFMYNRINKAASAYTHKTLRKIKRENKNEDDKENSVANFLHPSEIKETDKKKLNNTFKFTFVRNPHTRILSAYLEKIKHKKWKNNPHASGLKKWGCRSSKPSFREFIMYLKEVGLYEDQHWAPQASLLAIPVEKFDKIGKVESYNEDIKKILGNLNAGTINVEEILSCEREESEPKNVHATRASEKIDYYYNKELIDEVKKLYEKDFELLDYKSI